MTIEARFRDDDSIPTLHAGETVSSGLLNRPTATRRKLDRIAGLGTYHQLMRCDLPTFRSARSTSS
jgi:hypothetical protein